VLLFVLCLFVSNDGFLDVSIKDIIADSKTRLQNINNRPSTATTTTTTTTAAAESTSPTTTTTSATTSSSSSSNATSSTATKSIPKIQNIAAAQPTQTSRKRKSTLFTHLQHQTNKQTNHL
jgi:hypothetical protein